MDNIPEDVTPIELDTLPYDDNVPYEDQLQAQPEPPTLADRIGRSKVYLLSESSVSRVGKRKRGEEEVQVDIEPEDSDMDEDMSHRGNAILLRGSPISHLPTSRIFAYAAHFEATPMGLEWVDDNTCVLVFETKSGAQAALGLLRKTPDEVPDIEGFLTAKSIPMTFWPPEERISASLGKGEGLKGIIRMRWARHDDAKKKGARLESQFYKKHGIDAGKEVSKPSNPLSWIEDAEPTRETLEPSKRRRLDDAFVRAQLDDDLDAFLREDSGEELVPPSPPSKMRSDYIGADGRTLLERTSEIRAHPGHTLASRITADLPRRARQRGEEENGLSVRVGRSQRERKTSRDRSGRDRSGRRRRGRGEERERVPRKTKTQQELDDELDAFLNQRD
ncbi:hypothetical protein EW146_g1057 [Bondarzewia mesenterica]|uniref:Chromatin target of PRMT1 protein C-terminal domain-containing protein n=1 Tax=Bondarzewia mesenterica TaxID=1095465 RepID=A0A4S4M6G4_9AGAM|nr:hypothetical protein EW146_g1057 [Bondarzewia mesenterica]